MTTTVSGVPASHLDQETLKALFEQGACLLFINAPPAMEFGVDLHTWRIGPKFAGLKLIPPGLHFVHYTVLGGAASSGASDATAGQGIRHVELLAPASCFGMLMHFHTMPHSASSTGHRSGFLHFFREREILVREYDPATEDLVPAECMDQEQTARLQAAIREWEPRLGVYPLAEKDARTPTPHQPTTYQRWLQLTTHITHGVLESIFGTGRPALVSSASTLSRFSEEEEARAAGQSKTPAERTTRRGFEHTQGIDVSNGASTPRVWDAGNAAHRLQFTDIQLKASFPLHSTGVLRSHYAVDKSLLLSSIVQRMGGHTSALWGECQLAFLLFLVGYVYDGLEQWKVLVGVVCESAEAVYLGLQGSMARGRGEQPCPSPGASGAELFVEFVDVLRAQLQECPPDFFADAISGDSFLHASLVHLVQHVSAAQAQVRLDSMATKKLKALQVRLDAMLSWIKHRFGWDPRDEMGVTSPLDANGQPDDTAAPDATPVQSTPKDMAVMMLGEGEDLPVIVDEVTGRELSRDEVAALLQAVGALGPDGTDVDGDVDDMVDVF
jgi:A1 cistron-splicing factor AAR2